MAYRYWLRPRSTAHTATCVREVSPSLLRMLPTCISTVRSSITSELAISRFEAPRAFAFAQWLVAASRLDWHHQLGERRGDDLAEWKVVARFAIAQLENRRNNAPNQSESDTRGPPGAPHNSTTAAKVWPK